MNSFEKDILKNMGNQCRKSYALVQFVEFSKCVSDPGWKKDVAKTIVMWYLNK